LISSADVQSPGSCKSGDAVHHGHAQEKKFDQAREESVPALCLHGVEYISALSRQPVF
jgi:hypothetical protein